MDDEFLPNLGLDTGIRTYSRVVGDGVHSEFLIEHNLHRLVTVDVIDIASCERRVVTLEQLDLNRVRVSAQHIELNPETGAWARINFVPPPNSLLVRVTG